MGALMLFTKLNKLFTFFLWPLGVCLFVLSRVLLINFFKVVLLSSMLIGPQLWRAVHANEHATTPWVIDEQHILTTPTINGLTQILSGSARNRDIHVRVLVVSQDGENVKPILKQKIIEWKNKIPQHLREKTAFLVINIATGQSHIVLGNQIQQTESLETSLGRIQQKIILPGLQKGSIDSAVTEGVVGLTTVLDQWPALSTGSIFYHSALWLRAHYLMLPLQILFWISIILGGAKAIQFYLRRPKWDEMNVDLAAVEENMILNSISYKRHFGADQ